MSEVRQPMKIQVALRQRVVMVTTTWHDMSQFPVSKYTFLFMGSRPASSGGRILTIYTTWCVSTQKCAFYGSLWYCFPFRGWIPPNTFVAWIGVFKPNTQNIRTFVLSNNYCSDSNQICTIIKTSKYSSWMIPKFSTQIQDCGRHCHPNTLTFMQWHCDGW